MPATVADSYPLLVNSATAASRSAARALGRLGSRLGRRAITSPVRGILGDDRPRAARAVQRATSTRSSGATSTTVAELYAPDFTFWVNLTGAESSREQNLATLRDGYALLRRRSYDDRTIDTFGDRLSRALLRERGAARRAARARSRRASWRSARTGGSRTSTSTWTRASSAGPRQVRRDRRRDPRAVQPLLRRLRGRAGSTSWPRSTRRTASSGTTSSGATRPAPRTWPRCRRATPDSVGAPTTTARSTPSRAAS